jgi:glycosyltransferase involved in cell wall biosynthesis
MTPTQVPHRSSSDSDQGLVSCIIIFLDAAAYLAEAVESVLAQTYPHWELWLVDDGSSDGSNEIARGLANLCPQIHYLEHPGHANLGMSAARNLGLRHAQGDYVAFLDADDVWLPHKLAEQTTILRAHPTVGLVYGRTLVWHSWQRGGGPDRFYHLGVTPEQVVEPPRLFPLLLANRAQSPTTCNAIMRRALVEEVGGFEDPFRGMYEDQAFFVKTHLRTPIYVADQVWAKYRQHAAAGSAIHARSDDVHAARLRFLEWVAGYLDATRPHPPLVWRTLQIELWRARHPHLSGWLERTRRRIGARFGRGQTWTAAD